jgi:hypothetical protein
MDETTEEAAMENSEVTATTTGEPTPKASEARPAVESPPASGVPVNEEEVMEARWRLNELARQLRGAWSREGMVAYLKLRRQWR